MTDRAEEIRRMIDRDLPKTPTFNMPGLIEYPDFFYTPEGKFINPMGSSRIMGGTPGRAEEGFGRGKGRKGAEIATLDYSTLSIKDLIDRYGISREQAEKIVEFNTKQMIERSAGNRARSQDTSDNNLLEKILPFLGFSTRTPATGIMELMREKPPVSPGANEDLIFELMKEEGKETDRGRLAYGGRIGFEAGTRDGRTVGMSQNRVTQLLDLREEAVNKNDRDKIIQIDQELFTMGFITPKALGGRVGFKDGKLAGIVDIPIPGELDVYTKFFMEEEGLSRRDAEKKAEELLYGPDSQVKLKDSKRGLGSMKQMAMADEDEVKDPSDMLTGEAMEMFQSDPMEMIKEALEKGTLSQLPDSDIFAIYDAAVENGTFDGSFEEFKALLSQLQQQQRRPEGIMQTMVT